MKIIKIEKLNEDEFKVTLKKHFFESWNPVNFNNLLWIDGITYRLHRCEYSSKNIRVEYFRNAIYGH